MCYMNIVFIYFHSGSVVDSGSTTETVHGTPHYSASLLLLNQRRVSIICALDLFRYLLH